MCRGLKMVYINTHIAKYHLRCGKLQGSIEIFCLPIMFYDYQPEKETEIGDVCRCDRATGYNIFIVNSLHALKWKEFWDFL